MFMYKMLLVQKTPLNVIALTRRQRDREIFRLRKKKRYRDRAANKNPEQSMVAQHVIYNKEGAASYLNNNDIKEKQDKYIELYNVECIVFRWNCL